TDLSAWPSAKHFTSWLSLAPGNKISGGKILSSRTRPSGNRAAALLRLAATTVGRTETALGAFYRRLSARIGKAKAVTATARKIAVLFYNAVRHGMDYADPGASYYEERYRQRVLTNLQRRAKAFGYVLQPTEIKVVSMAVSLEGRGLLREGIDVKFGFIAKHRGIWPAGWLCEALGVSRGGFYAWLTRPRSQRSRSDEELGAKVRISFVASDRTCGARRVWKDMLAEGLSCGLHRIERLMRLQALKARPRRRRPPPDLGERAGGALGPTRGHPAVR